MVGDGTNNDTTFYITLTIEQDDDDDDPLERIDSKYILLRRHSVENIVTEVNLSILGNF